VSATPIEAKPRDAALYAGALAISVVALIPIVYVLLLKDRGAGSPGSLAFMPAVNASLNAVAAACQISAFMAIRRRRVELHKRLMLAAMASSAAFFVGYLVYHWVHGDTKYPGTGALRTVYLAMLASHVILSIVLVPMLLVVLYRAFTGSFQKHRGLARVTLPIWLYVSVTGILVFFMLRMASP